MEVKLVIATGNDAGKEIRLHGPKFFIGRAEDCHLRPQSGSVSRYHCVVLVEKGFVSVRDLGGGKGTFVNGDRIRSEHEVMDRDRIRVGELEFDVRLDVRAAEKESGLPARQEAPTVSKDLAIEDDLDLDHWLNDTQVCDATDRADAFEQPDPESPDDEKAERKKKRAKEKPVEVVGVWKKGHWKPTSVDPGQAAADALKDLFKRH